MLNLFTRVGFVFFFLKVEVEKKKRKEMHVVYETNIHEWKDSAENLPAMTIQWDYIERERELRG